MQVSLIIRAGNENPDEVMTWVSRVAATLGLHYYETTIVVDSDDGEREMLVALQHSHLPCGHQWIVQRKLLDRGVRMANGLTLRSNATAEGDR